jgi:hypothetical protein
MRFYFFFVLDSQSYDIDIADDNLTVDAGNMLPDSPDFPMSRNWTKQQYDLISSGQ